VLSLAWVLSLFTFWIREGKEKKELLSLLSLQEGGYPYKKAFLEMNKDDAEGDLVRPCEGQRRQL
jgi:hypothetical protein